MRTAESVLKLSHQATVDTASAGAKTIGMGLLVSLTGNKEELQPILLEYETLKEGIDDPLSEIFEDLVAFAQVRGLYTHVLMTGLVRNSSGNYLLTVCRTIGTNDDQCLIQAPTDAEPLAIPVPLVNYKFVTEAITNVKV